MSLLSCLTLVAAVISPVAAQTWTLCNPLNQTGCPTDTALGTNHTFDFTSSSAGSTWNTTAGNIVYGTNGAEFTISAKGDAPTIQTNFYLFFGVVEVWMKAASGQGVVSSIVLESDDLDEVDLEIIGSNTSFAETNYYGKGNTTDAFDRAKWHPMATSPQSDFHNYTTDWTAEKIDWYIDGNLTRTLLYADANGGASFPQTPMNLRLGVWAAGDPANNNYTIAWAGGEIDYNKGPYTMYVKSARVTDASSGKEYKYGDQTGTWKSIQIVAGNSTSADTLSAPPAKTVAQRWASLSTGAKTGIFSSVGAVAAILVALLALYCIKQRRLGLKERAIADAIYEKETAELLTFRAQGREGWERI